MSPTPTPAPHAPSSPPPPEEGEPASVLAAQAEAELRLIMADALGGGCCPRHVALGSHRIPVEQRHPSDGPCGPLTDDDIGVMIEVAHEGLAAPDPRSYGTGVLRAVLVLAATLAAERAS